MICKSLVHAQLPRFNSQPSNKSRVRRACEQNTHLPNHVIVALTDMWGAKIRLNSKYSQDNFDSHWHCPIFLLAASLIVLVFGLKPTQCQISQTQRIIFINCSGVCGLRSCSDESATWGRSHGHYVSGKSRPSIVIKIVRSGSGMISHWYHISYHISNKSITIFGTVALWVPELVSMLISLAVLALITHDTNDAFHFILLLILSKFVHSTVDHSPASRAKLAFPGTVTQR